jgi:NAD(P)-dependent dehydrogenase (short-subunit alcohol dehydrogenase family)
MMKELAGKAAVVTGGARGLGAVTARGYVEAGMRVAIMDLRDDAGHALARELGDAATFIPCDVSSPDSVERGFEMADQSLGGIDILAAAAGLDRPGHAAGEISFEIWSQVIGVNATGTFLTNQAAYRRMRARGWGRIINFSSVAGIRGYAGRAAYAASKGAVMAWTRSAAQAWGAQGIVVNAVAPQMRTEVADRYIASRSREETEAFEAHLAKVVPVEGRLGDPDQEFLPLMLFLAGDGVRFITGQTFAVDGGMTMLGS